jgi:hypothetical protein
MNTEMALDIQNFSISIRDEFVGIRWQAMPLIYYSIFAQNSYNRLRNSTKPLMLQTIPKIYLCNIFLKIHFIKANTLNMHGYCGNSFKVSKVLKHILIL